MADKTYPQFFCGLGFPKTGTTWLAHYLGNRSDTFMLTGMKELQVFNRRFRADLYEYMDSLIAENLVRTTNRLISKRSNIGQLAEKTALIAEALALPHHPDPKYMMRAYRRLFRGRLEPEHLAFGEFSTTYCLLPTEGLRLLETAFPNTLYIIILRDPTSRFWSHVKHQIRIRENFDPLTQYEDMFQEPELCEMADYRTVISNIQSVIPSERIHYAIYEDLFVQHEEEALRGITNFLGIPYIPANLDEIVYQGVSTPMPDKFITMAMEKFQDSYLFGTELFGKMPKHWGEH